MAPGDDDQTLSEYQCDLFLSASKTNDCMRLDISCCENWNSHFTSPRFRFLFGKSTEHAAVELFKIFINTEKTSCTLDQETNLSATVTLSKRKERRNWSKPIPEMHHLKLKDTSLNQINNCINDSLWRISSKCNGF